MTTLAIVQARMASTRFPGKVLQEVNGESLISIMLRRLSTSSELDKILVATTDTNKDDVLAMHVQNLGFSVFRGSENNVLGRYYQAADLYEPTIIVRLTGDCPLIDSTIVDAVITKFKNNDADYTSNVSPATFPDGLDVEVFSFDALKKAWHEAKNTYEQEHVTVYIRESGRFTTANFTNEIDYSAKRWTVDERPDFEVIQAVVNHFHPRKDFSWKEIIELEDKQPDIFITNSALSRNEGSAIRTGQKLWKRAKTVIPGGNMLLSKRSEMFLPEQWPSYFSKSDGCTVWDMDGVAYTDMSVMGVGTNTLGYGHPEVNAAVSGIVSAGNMSTLNAPEEVYLAERLIEMHPFADMARFCRSGGEANAVAVRIARAASGKDKIAFCGYHGWHDWYLAANLGDEQILAGHLLPGLEPNGVPHNLSGSVLPFNYNRFDELETLITNHEIGVIKMEVSRNSGPEDNFLQKVRDIATANNIVLVFDECTSGFRETFGGLHKKYEVEPDLAIFGKALGNGYAITAVIGKRDVMEAAQSTFISSTFWTERIGSVAALKTLEVMERERSWEKITAQGHEIKQRWQELATYHDLEIEQWGLPSLCGFDFISEQAIAYKTLMTQEMLTNGFLGGDCVYSSLAHTPEVRDRYFEIVDDIFDKVKQCEDGLDISTLLNGPVCHTRFKRLN